MSVMGPLMMLLGLSLFISSMTLLGKIPREATWPLWFATSIITFICALYIAMTGAGPVPGMAASMSLIFAVDYLISGLEITRSIDMKLHGYFYIFATVFLGLVSVTYYVVGANAWAACAMLWTSITFLAASIMVFGMPWMTQLGYLCLVSSFVTLFLPAYTLIMGKQLP